jgi:hypothetical protein
MIEHGDLEIYVGRTEPAVSLRAGIKYYTWNRLAEKYAVIHPDA